jgi:single-strand DNA-binding protein
LHFGPDGMAGQVGPVALPREGCSRVVPRPRVLGAAVGVASGRLVLEVMRVSTSEERADNEVRLVGRVSGCPVEKVMPSGDRLWTFRVVVARSADAAGRQRVDALECVAWGARVRRSVASWRDGDRVEIAGELRRRFYRAGGATVSRVEVEALRARVIRRAANA